MATWSENSRKAGNVTFTACSIDDKVVQLTLNDAQVVFEPSCWQADGTETRLTVVFSGVDEDIKKRLLAMEHSIGATTSCIKDDTVRVKINMDKVRIYDANRTIVDAPKTWRGWSVNAFLHLRGKWQTRQGSGLSIDVMDLQFLEASKERPCPF